MTGPDFAILAAFLVVALIVGLLATPKAGKNAEEYFLSGRRLPWWLLGISIVATTFSADTPNLVTDIVRQHGVAGNWLWWAFLLTGMLTVFVYARLWRRSAVMTDLGFYELRYGGPAAAFLRGFRAIYLGVVFNVVIMATVMLAGIKMAGILMGWSPVQTVLLAGGVTLAYSVLGGLRGVIWTDFLMFMLAMAGAIAAAVFALRHPSVGGLEGLVAHFEGTSTLDMIPELTDPSAYVPLLLVPLLVQWWSVWYPGAEPGGGGYAAQRMLAARDEKNALGAVLLFNVLHYAIRPWPWILVALASLIVYPDLASLKLAFPDLDPSVVKDDLAYPAMLHQLPPGWLGLVATSLIAAFMSTISTHLNWGASYLVHDFWVRYFRPETSPSGQVSVGRWSTVLLMALAMGLSLLMSSALDAFTILLQIGAGTGLIYILRWFWWRINAWTEISGMVLSFAVAIYFALFHPGGMAPHLELVTGVAVTTLGWLICTLLTRPEKDEVLVAFFQKIRPGGPGWAAVAAQVNGQKDPTARAERSHPMLRQLLAMSLGCMAVFSALFATGYVLYGQYLSAGLGAGIALLTGGMLFHIVRGMLKEDG